MKDNEEKKATIVIILIICAILLSITIPLIISSNKKRDKESFPEYNEVNISENKLNDQKEYNNIIKELEKEYNFKKISIMPNFNYKYYNSSKLKMMLWNLIYNYSINNTNYFTSKDMAKGIYCMKRKTLINAFEELYSVDISNDLDYLPGYYEYIYENGNIYCLNFNTVSIDYDNRINVAIEKLTMNKKIITADMYVYEYYHNYDDQNTQMLEESIDNKDYLQASNIVISNLNGKVSHKQLQFEILEDEKYFKYKILVSKELDY